MTEADVAELGLPVCIAINKTLNCNIVLSALTWRRVAVLTPQLTADELRAAYAADRLLP